MRGRSIARLHGPEALVVETNAMAAKDLATMLATARRNVYGHCRHLAVAVEVRKQLASAQLPHPH